MQSILDNDLYKFTTSYAYMKLFPNALGTFTFIDRNQTLYTEAFVHQLKQTLEKECKIVLLDDEFEFMVTSLKFIPRWYFEWLRAFRFDSTKLDIHLSEEGELSITVSGLLYAITLWEVYILSSVSQVYYAILNTRPDRAYLERLRQKLNYADHHQIRFTDFGTRRRFSEEVHNTILSNCREHKSFIGTSNCYFAYKYNLKMVGTHPHEWFMFHGAIYGPREANYIALENWVAVYDGDLGIALTDTYTVDIFLQNFSLKQSKLFDGVRHDSGDPFIFTDKILKHYRDNNIDPRTKTIVFSDALTFELAGEIRHYCNGKINCSFGIGTNLTNDTGHQPLNIVMKLTECRMNENAPLRACVKLSDVQGKYVGTPEEIDIYLRSLALKE